MEIHCKAGLAVRAVALAFAAGAAVGGGIVGYAQNAAPTTHDEARVPHPSGDQARLVSLVAPSGQRR